MRLALILAYRILQFSMPAHHAAPNCSQGTALPPSYAYAYVEVQASAIDSLHWIAEARWGAMLVPPGGAYRVACWPDSGFAWWRCRAVNWADSASCWSAATHK